MSERKPELVRTNSHFNRATESIWRSENNIYKQRMDFREVSMERSH